MDSKNILSVAFGFLLASCSANTKKENFAIGEPLQAYSLPASTTASFGNENFWYYDKYYGLIQQFDMKQQRVLARVPTSAPISAEHSLIADEKNNFVISLTKKQLTIFKFQNTPDTTSQDSEPNDSLRKVTGIIENPIRLVGTPRSAAYEPLSRVFVFYDELGTVGILKLSETGDVLASFTGGSGIVSGELIQSGDLDDEGHLILGLSSNTVLKLVIEDVLKQQKWIATPIVFENLLTEPLVWIAPIKNSTWVMGRTNSQAILFNRERLPSDTLVTYPIAPTPHTSSLFSKGLVPHILVQSNRAQNETNANNSSTTTKLVYAQLRENIQGKTGSEVLKTPENTTATVPLLAFAEQEIPILTAPSEVPRQLFKESLITSVFETESTPSTQEKDNKDETSIQKQSYVPTDSASLSLVLSSDLENRFLRTRLIDMLFTQDLSIKKSLTALFTREWFYGFKTGGLGYIEAKKIDSDFEFQQKGFMFEYLQEK